MKNNLTANISGMKKQKKTILLISVFKSILKIVILVWIVLNTNTSSAQTTNKLLREGNSFYKNDKYNNATESYSKALQKAPKDVRANFNQGDALFKLNQLEKAQEQYRAAAKLTKNTDIQAEAYYNIGNSFYKQEKYEESVKAYKTSLKLNPKDKEAKYNLLMALAKLKKNGGGGKDKQKNKDQKENKENKKENKDQQQNKPSEQNGNNKPQEQQGKQNPQQAKEQQAQMSNEEAQRLLEAIGSEENKVQQKLTKEKGNPKNIKVQKDW